MTSANDASLVLPANHVVTCYQQTIASQVCHGQLCLVSCRQYLVARPPAARCVMDVPRTHRRTLLAIEHSLLPFRRSGTVCHTTLLTACH